MRWVGHFSRIGKFFGKINKGYLLSLLNNYVVITSSHLFAGNLVNPLDIIHLHDISHVVDIYQQAIDDFEVFIAWLAEQPGAEQGALRQRQAWVKALKAGENPFTPAVMEALRH